MLVFHSKFNQEKTRQCHVGYHVISDGIVVPVQAVVVWCSSIMYYINWTSRDRRTLQTSEILGLILVANPHRLSVLSCLLLIFIYSSAAVVSPSPVI
jgi:hypothetical protein